MPRTSGSTRLRESSNYFRNMSVTTIQRPQYLVQSVNMAKVLLSDVSESSSSDSESGGADLDTSFKVNEEYAKRFEHNKKREELAKLEEKHGAQSRKRKRDVRDDAGSESDSSSSEDEDDEGELATAALDDEIFATLNAIKSKDPRVYDENVTFYTETDEGGQSAKGRKEKPVFLRDYHRQNLLNGNGVVKEEEPLSYNQEQERLKKSIVNEMHAAAQDGSDEDESDQEGGLLIRKSKPQRGEVKQVELDVENADRDPETFLSNFMAARAWVPTERAELHPFESDDEEEEKRAEIFEEAYNMRFEAPEKSNEALRSYARDTAAKFSVRRDEQNPRKKKRDAEKASKEAAKQELREEKARLKKLRMEEVEDKVKRIKRAAGLKSTDLQPEDWQRFIDDEWDDSKWENEMQRRFGDHYYAEQDAELSGSEGDDEAASKKQHKKPKKPKFEDDIDIKDIIPDFVDEDEEAANFSLTEDDDADEEGAGVEKKKKSKSKKQERIDKQKDSRRERRIIEALVDDQLQMDLDQSLPASSRQKGAGFRYRETSPQAFGLTARDILLAEDKALNEYAGLKKLASWRDDDKKQKDRKRLGKKARLRKWRMDTFGNEEGPIQEIVEQNGTHEDVPSDEEMGGVDIREGTKKKKGRRRKKAKTNGEAVAT